MSSTLYTNILFLYVSFPGSNIRYAPLTYNVVEEQGYVTVSVSIAEPYFEDFNIRVFDRQFSSPPNGFAISKRHFSSNPCPLIILLFRRI